MTLSARAIEEYLWKWGGVILLLLGWEIGTRVGWLPVRYVSSPTAVSKTAMLR